MHPKRKDYSTSYNMHYVNYDLWIDVEKRDEAWRCVDSPLMAALKVFRLRSYASRHGVTTGSYAGCRAAMLWVRMRLVEARPCRAGFNWLGRLEMRGFPAPA